MVRDIKAKNEKLVERGRGLGYVTYFSNFGTPLISPEWLKIQTSNFACGLKVGNKESKIGFYFLKQIPSQNLNPEEHFRLYGRHLEKSI